MMTSPEVQKNPKNINISVFFIAHCENNRRSKNGENNDLPSKKTPDQKTFPINTSQYK